MATKKKALQAAAGAAGGDLLAIEDVFSTYLYTGNGSTQVIENGINLGQSFGSGSAEFDGTGAVGLEFADDTALQFGTGDYCLECWVWADDLGTNSFGGIIAKRASSGSWFRLTYEASSGQITYNDGLTTVGFNFSTTGQWVHLAVTRSGTTLRIFKDGVLQASGTSGQNVSYVGIPFRIGALTGDNSNYAWNGYIAGVRAVKGDAVYTANFTPPTSPLTAITGTGLLTAQGDNPLSDTSANAFTPNSPIEATAATFGPFDAATPGEGGLVWLKDRVNSNGHVLYDTERGAYPSAGFLVTNDTIAESTTLAQQYAQLTSFNSDGFTVGPATITNVINGSGGTYASWTFRKAPRFFDVVTYTGDGVGDRQVSHNLGIKPGFVVYKRTDSTSDWPVAARTSDGNVALFNVTTSAAGLNLTAPAFGIYPDSAFWSDSSFAVNTLGTNISGANYVAYLFAHDPLGPSGDGSDGLIACGSALGGSNFVDLGWEPQWILMKTTATGSWRLVDSMRGLTADGGNATLFANLSNAESSLSSGFVKTYATGFSAEGAVASDETYIYIAIRRGPMRQPTSGTEVFNVTHRGTTEATNNNVKFYAGFPIDVAWQNDSITAAFGTYFTTRLTGGNTYLYPYSTAVESSVQASDDMQNNWGKNTGTASESFTSIAWMFRRAPGFFDVVTVTATSDTDQVLNHNLAATPELIIAKSRSAVGSWYVYYQTGGVSSYLVLNSSEPSGSYSNIWGSTSPTETDFRINGPIYGVGNSIVAYLFATLPGVSKVGSYTGNGSSQTIDCGFTTGARFVLIKGADVSSSWSVFDVERGITSGNDPLLRLNTAEAELTTYDSIDPESSGFIVNEVATGLNASGTSYIYLAIA